MIYFTCNENPSQRAVYVVDEEKHLVGTVTLLLVLQKIFPEEFPEETFPVVNMDLIYTYMAENAGELMRKLTQDYVTDEDMLIIAFNKMKEYFIAQLPIVNEKKQILGVLHIEHIMEAWYQKAYNPSKK